MKMLVLFLAKLFRPPQKPWSWAEKTKKHQLCYIWHRKRCEILRNQAVCQPSLQQNWQGKFELFAWTLSPNFFRLNWTFCLPPKRQLSILLNFFSINKFVFDFCCLCLFCYNMGHHAISCQKCGIQHRVISSVCHFILVTLWCRRTDGHVTITSLPVPKFLGFIGYQFCLVMVLRWRASARTPLQIRLFIQVSTTVLT